MTATKSRSLDAPRRATSAEQSGSESELWHYVLCGLAACVLLVVCAGAILWTSSSPQPTQSVYDSKTGNVDICATRTDSSGRTVRDGAAQRVDANGNILISGYFRLNKRHGVWTYKDTGGKVLTEEVWRDGDLVEWSGVDWIEYSGFGFKHASVTLKDIVAKSGPSASGEPNLMDILLVFEPVEYGSTMLPSRFASLEMELAELANAYVQENHQNRDYVEQLVSGLGTKVKEFCHSKSETPRVLKVRIRLH